MRGAVGLKNHRDRRVQIWEMQRLAPHGFGHARRRPDAGSDVQEWPEWRNGPAKGSDVQHSCRDDQGEQQVQDARHPSWAFHQGTFWSSAPFCSHV